MIARLKEYAWVAGFLVAMLLGAYVANTVSKGRVAVAETTAKAAQGEAKAARTELAANRLAEAVRESQRARVARATKENHDRLQKSLGESPAWAAEPVPDAVADSLRHAARADPPQPPQ